LTNLTKQEHLAAASNDVLLLLICFLIRTSKLG